MQWGRWLIEQLQRQIVIRMCRYAMPWPSLLLGIQPAQSLWGLHVWFQYGTRVCSILIGLLPIAVERPESAVRDHATPLGRKTEASSSPEETAAEERKRPFYFEGRGGHA
jgi:hypothetical protein